MSDYLNVVEIPQHRLIFFAYSHYNMIQSDTEKRILGLGGIVQTLCSAAKLEARILNRGGYDEGKTEAYRTVYEGIRQVSGLELPEFERKIDEFKVSEILHLERDGKYELVYMEGRITTLIPSALIPDRKKK